MPFIEQSSYRAPTGFSNGHAQTIFPTLFRKVPLLTTERARLETDDGDFLDLDWLRNRGSRKIAILTHGLEGSSRNAYIQGMARACLRRGWDALAWNLRGCSGESNRLPRFYHSGATDDLDAVIQHTLSTGQYDAVFLIGFSLGGNLLLKYLGDSGSRIDPRIHRAAALSVPCDLAAASRKLSTWSNRIYMARFMKTLRRKVREKIPRFPDQLQDHGLAKMQSFREFDDAYTAPLHGFSSAEDYWARCSCLPVLQNIAIPTLLINARNDPFLPEECFPVATAKRSPHFYLEIPKTGGHVGFVQFNKHGEYWSERRIFENF